MKRNETTIKKVVAGKNGKMTLEKLARMMAQGFENTKEELRQEFRQGQAKLEQGQAKLEQGQEESNRRLLALEQGQEGLRQEVSSLKEEQKEINRIVKSTERKQIGILISLDETVHRSEFKKLEHRVEMLES